MSTCERRSKKVAQNSQSGEKRGRIVTYVGPVRRPRLILAGGRCQLVDLGPVERLELRVGQRDERSRVESVPPGLVRVPGGGPAEREAYLMT